MSNHDWFTVGMTAPNLELARELAGLRNKKEKMGITSKRISDFSERDVHYIGALGEVAVAKAMHLPLNRSFYLNGDGGADFVYNGFAVDVKTRTKIGWDMLFSEDWSDLRADLFILAWINHRGNQVTLAGWEWADNLSKVAVKQQYRKTAPPRWAIRHYHLQPMRDLKQIGSYSETENRI